MSRDGSGAIPQITALEAPISIRPEILKAFRLPGEVQIILFSGDHRPDWALDMAWRGDETVACGDRFYARPDWTGFSLVATDAGLPVGYVSAVLQPAEPEAMEVVVDMIQVAADRRHQRFGCALMAGLAELIFRDIDAHCQAKTSPPVWYVLADTEGAISDRLIRKFERVLDTHLDACFEAVEAAAISEEHLRL